MLLSYRHSDIVQRGRYTTIDTLANIVARNAVRPNADPKGCELKPKNCVVVSLRFIWYSKDRLHNENV
ncbi:hypothetical protein C5167_030070 [Papaver somniferum]|nr:hypothetical protein C5167_030070 [Papaver somniferum]